MDLELEQNNISRYKSRVILGQAERPKVLDMILKTGLVKSEEGAVRVIMGLTVFIFALSIFIFMKTFSTPEIEVIPVEYPNAANSSDL